jgi:uncharacterized membrane protein YgdD (TMEM256/DUF423 family)
MKIEMGTSDDNSEIRGVKMNVLLFFVGISGAFSVLFGAWLSHSDFVLTADSLMAIDKALLYQFIHTLALYITLFYVTFSGQLSQKVTLASTSNRGVFSSAKLLTAASIFFALGILLFSGGIYFKVLFNVFTFTQFIPLGGFLFAIAWCLIAISAIKLVKTDQIK